MLSNISVVIVTFNSQSHIGKCVNSLVKYENKLLKEILIIDNASSDHTVETIERYRNPKIRLLTNKKNLGFASAVNTGIKMSEGEYVLLLNPDTEIDHETFSQLLKSGSKKSIGIIGGQMVGGNGYIHKTHVRFPNFLIGLFDFTNLMKLFPNNKWHNKFYYLDVEQNGVMDVDAVSGGYMLIKREVVDKVGLLNERYFMYLEDIEYCKKAKEAGFRVLYCPKSQIYHEGGASSKNRDRIDFEAWVKSRKYYFKNNESVWVNAIIQPLFLLDELLMRIWRRLR